MSLGFEALGVGALTVEAPGDSLAELLALGLRLRSAEVNNRWYQPDRHDEKTDDGQQIYEPVLHSVEPTLGTRSSKYKNRVVDRGCRG